MRVHLDKIGPEGYDLDTVVRPPWIDRALGEKSPFSSVGDGRVTAHLQRLDDAIHVRGRLVLALGASCSRCLGAVAIAVDVPLQVTLFPAGAEPPAGSDGELSQEDLGVGTYHNKEIDLSQVVRDEVFLELPMSPICKETCAGLCPQCGTNRNEQQCSCAPESDARWSALEHVEVDP